MANTTGTIYLAGGCFWGVEELFRQLPGVEFTQVGYANGNSESNASYERVCAGDTGFQETVKLCYESATVSLDHILWAFFRIVDPTLINRQGNDQGTQYQTGIFWNKDDDDTAQAVLRVAAFERECLESEGKVFNVVIRPLKNFFPAEEYHQHYLVKNPGGYCHVSPTEMREVLSHNFDENYYQSHL